MSDFVTADRGTRSRLPYPPHDPTLPVVCFDFDGVFAENKWPSPHIGRFLGDAFEAAAHYFLEGCQVIILTARPESHFPRIWEWLRANNADWIVYDVTNRKPVASIYFDDRAYRWPLEAE